ncbi:MAG: DUF6485 family protein [Candidatus Firestonebacteria bacterium]
MDCKKKTNLSECNCTYPCSRKGICCECITYHRDSGELPACYFTKEGEASCDRSIESYLKHRKK